jgi:hypothetical protein
VDHLPKHPRPKAPSSATGPSPVDRGKAGSKHHLIVEAHGIPLAAITTGGNRNDVTRLIPLIQAVPPIRGKRGQPPRRRPRYLYADRGYDHEVYRDKVRRFQITPHIARRGTGPAPAWACTAGSWKERPRCRTGSAACVPAGRSATTSTTRSSPLAAPSSVGDDCALHFVESKGERSPPGMACSMRQNAVAAVGAGPRSLTSGTSARRPHSPARTGRSRARSASELPAGFATTTTRGSRRGRCRCHSRR